MLEYIFYYDVCNSVNRCILSKNLVMKKLILSMIAIIIIVIMAFSPKDKHTVSGIIKDENNNPVAMASIQLKGTHTGTTAGKNVAY